MVFFGIQIGLLIIFIWLQQDDKILQKASYEKLMFQYLGFIMRMTGQFMQKTFEAVECYLFFQNLCQIYDIYFSGVHTFIFQACAFLIFFICIQYNEKF